MGRGCDRYGAPDLGEIGREPYRLERGRVRAGSADPLVAPNGANAKQNRPSPDPGDEDGGPSSRERLLGNWPAARAVYGLFAPVELTAPRDRRLPAAFRSRRRDSIIPRPRGRQPVWEIAGGRALAGRNEHGPSIYRLEFQDGSDRIGKARSRRLQRDLVRAVQTAQPDH